jgi:hypothetical protein
MLVTAMVVWLTLKTKMRSMPKSEWRSMTMIRGLCVDEMCQEPELLDELPYRLVSTTTMPSMTKTTTTNRQSDAP